MVIMIYRLTFLDALSQLWTVVQTETWTAGTCRCCCRRRTSTDGEGGGNMLHGHRCKLDCKPYHSYCPYTQLAHIAWQYPVTHPFSRNLHVHKNWQRVGWLSKYKPLWSWHLWHFDAGMVMDIGANFGQSRSGLSENGWICASFCHTYATAVFLIEQRHIWCIIYLFGEFLEASATCMQVSRPPSGNVLFLTRWFSVETRRLRTSWMDMPVQAATVKIYVWYVVPNYHWVFWFIDITRRRLNMRFCVMNSPGRGRGTQSSCREGNSRASCSSNQLWTTHFGGRETRQREIRQYTLMMETSSFKVWKHVKMFWFQFQTLLHAHSFWLQENSQAKAVVVLQCLCRAANCRRKPFGMDLQPLGLQNAPTAVIPLRQSLWSRQSSTLTRKIRNGAVLHGTLSPIFGMENTKSSYVLQVLRSVTIAMLFFFSIWSKWQAIIKHPECQVASRQSVLAMTRRTLVDVLYFRLGFPKTLGIWILWRGFPMISLHSKTGWQRFPRNLFGEKAIELDVEATNLSASSWECTNLRGISWCTAVPCRLFLRDMARLCWGAQMLKLVLFWIVLSLSLSLSTSTRSITKSSFPIILLRYLKLDTEGADGMILEQAFLSHVPCRKLPGWHETWTSGRLHFVDLWLPYVPSWKSPDTVGSDVAEAFVPLLWS